jgi:hypothetical protein
MSERLLPRARLAPDPLPFTRSKIFLFDITKVGVVVVAVGRDVRHSTCALVTTRAQMQFIHIQKKFGWVHERRRTFGRLSVATRSPLCLDESTTGSAAAAAALIGLSWRSSVAARVVAARAAILHLLSTLALSFRLCQGAHSKIRFLDQITFRSTFENQVS